jgi:methionyl-tRNA formyltransferase
MGTPEFAVEGLKALVENGYNIVGVITSPDKPQGRGLKMGQSAVKEYAVSKNLHVLQPEKLKDEAFINELKSLKADLQIVVAFRMLPEIVWNMPPMGTFNLHASLLPNYRGAAPINWSIINGETETGVTTFFLKHEIDTGDIILQEKTPILPEDNVGSLYEKLMKMGAETILETVKQIERGKVNQTPQTMSTYLKPAPKIFKEHCKIDFGKSAQEIHNLVRGLSPYPSAFMLVNGLNCKVFATKFNTHTNLKKGDFEIRNGNSLFIGTQIGEISIEDLQLEGKKRMDIKSFLLGNKILSVA